MVVTEIFGIDHIREDLKNVIFYYSMKMQKLIRSTILYLLSTILIPRLSIICLILLTVVPVGKLFM